MSDESSPEVLTGSQLADYITRGARGDEAACAVLFRYYYPQVVRLCVGLLNDLEDAEEVAQDTFVYALRNLARYDSAKAEFRTWLFMIALSRCRNKRRRKWLASVPLDLLSVEPATPARLVETLLERRGVRRQVWDALQQLPAQLQEAIVLRYLGGLRYNEVGRALKCNPKTAESRVRLGLTALRRTAQALEIDCEMALAELSA